MSNAVVAKAIYGNGCYLHDDKNENIIIFSSEEEAQRRIEQAIHPFARPAWGFIHSIGTCRKCGSPLFPSDVPESGYKSQCFTCDEDFFGFEQDTE